MSVLAEADVIYYIPLTRGTDHSSIFSYKGSVSENLLLDSWIPHLDENYK
jgi:hypothetical protein